HDPAWRARRGLGAGKLAQGKVLNDDRADWREAYALFPGDVAYIWHGALHGDVVAAGLAACGMQPRAQIVWVKQHFTLSRAIIIGSTKSARTLCARVRRATGKVTASRRQSGRFPTIIRSATGSASRAGDMAPRSRSNACAV